MMIRGSTALVTGANRGLGSALVRALRAGGCAKIYAAARNIAGVAPDRVVHPVQLDITSAEEVAAAAARCQDVDILINNAGVAGFKPALGAPTMEHARAEMETNYFGTLAMCRAFAPVLKRNGGGALINVLSVVSWFNAPVQGSYCASKAAEWSLTRAARFELRAQGTLVVGVFAGYIDTDMTRALDERIQEGALGFVPAKRVGTAAEVAGVVSFLASEDATYISGAVIPVDGGMGMGH